MRFFSFLFFFTAYGLAGQGVEAISLNGRGASESEKRSMQPINRFILMGDTVHEPLDLASAIPGQAVRTYRIGLPKTWDSLAMRHSYAWVYALQNEKSPVPDHSLVLFEEKLIRGQWMRKTWVDKNGDLVFDAFEKADTSWQINSDWMLQLG
ncbi:MAG: hypothetical protein ACO3DK_08850, partial [Bacteroidia bacterium]